MFRNFPLIDLATQEEDFVANLYHRNLLRQFDVNDVQKILDQAISHVSSDGNANARALLTRLSLRKAFLSAVTVDGIFDQARTTEWEQCLTQLPSLLKTNANSVPDFDSYSIKVQRKLASSVPPRPIANVDFGDAFAFLEKLCQHGRDVYRVLEYHGGSNLQVWRN